MTLALFFKLSLPSKINPNPEKECGGKRIRIIGKITGINCDRRDA